MKKIILFILGIVLLSSFVIASNDFIESAFEKTQRIDEGVIIFYNMTIHQDETICIGIENTETFERFNCTCVSSASPVAVEIENQKCRIYMNDTGNFYLYDQHNGDPIEYHGIIKIQNKLPTWFSLILLIVGLILLILALVSIPPLLLISIPFLLTSGLLMVFRYSYLLGSVTSGILFIVYVILIAFIITIIEKLLK